jgi:hypothetical protein
MYLTAFFTTSGRNAHAFRNSIITQLLRLFAGDNTLHEDIRNNANSRGPVNNMAREQLRSEGAPLSIDQDARIWEEMREARLSEIRGLNDARLSEIRIQNVLDRFGQVAGYNAGNCPPEFLQRLRQWQTSTMEELFVGVQQQQQAAGATAPNANHNATTITVQSWLGDRHLVLPDNLVRRIGVVTANIFATVFPLHDRVSRSDAPGEHAHRHYRPEDAWIIERAYEQVMREQEQNRRPPAAAGGLRMT